MTTAWGEVEMSVADTGLADVMGSPLESLGYIKEDSLVIVPEDGGALQLFGSGHVLLDELKNEPTLKVNCTLIGIANATQFWTLDGATQKVQSLINSGNFSIQFAAKVVGSDTFMAPKCKIYATPVYSEKEGWTVNLEITIVKGEAGYLFEFGTVA